MDADSISCSTLDSTHVFIAYNNLSNTKGYGVIGVFTAPDTIAFGTPVAYTGSAVSDQACAKIDSNQIYVTFADGTPKGLHAIAKFTSPDVVSFGTQYYTNPPSGSSVTFNSCALIDNKHLLLVNEDSANKGIGKIVYFNGISTISTISTISAIANETITSGNSGDFTILKPYTKITNSSLSLTAGVPYFVGSNSELQTAVDANYYVGFALDATSIFIDPMYFLTTASTTAPVSLQRK